MTASEVIAAVRAAAPHIDTSTVYRTLSDLRDTGLIAETLLGYGESLYEWIGDDPHQHFKCSNCGRLERVDPAITAALVRSAATRHGFAVDLAHMVFAGECASCHAARRSGR
jgi:Fur family ferric uptake transcriptional regulator